MWCGLPRRGISNPSALAPRTQVVLFAKKRDIVDGVHAQFRCVWRGSGVCPVSRSSSTGDGFPNPSPPPHPPPPLPPPTQHCIPEQEEERAHTVLGAGDELLLTPHPHPQPYTLPPRSLSRQKSVRKQYLALAVGVPPEQEFTVDAPIDRDEEDQ